MRTLLVLLLSLPMAFAAPVPKEVKKQTELDRFVGQWWESCFNGKVSADASTSRRFVFNQDGVAGIILKEGAVPYEYNFNQESEMKR